jgi:F0F1-type ATP synthase gamma subunit
MEDARQNIGRLVEELELEAVQAYRQSITRELQNLAVGSGLLQED